MDNIIFSRKNNKINITKIDTPRQLFIIKCENCICNLFKDYEFNPYFFTKKYIKQLYSFNDIDEILECKCNKKFLLILDKLNIDKKLVNNFFDRWRNFSCSSLKEEYINDLIVLFKNHDLKLDIE